MGLGVTTKFARAQFAGSTLLMLAALTVSGGAALADGGSLPRNINAVVNSATPSVPVSERPPAHLQRAYEQRFGERGREQLAKAMAAQERHSDALMRSEDILGTAVGWAENDAAVVKVYTQETGSAAGLPESVDGIPVIVESIGRIYALGVSCETRGNCEVLEATASAGEPATQKDWHERPIPIGVSIGPSNEYIAGTLGCRVTSGCHTYGLTNNHVIAGENDNPVGTSILQPGRYDGGVNPTDKVGELEAFVPIVFSTSFSTRNKVDAAIFKADFTQVGTATRSDGYGTPKSTTVAAAVGMDVQKYGRTTGETYGYIDAINAIVNVAYDTGDARFVNQIVIKKIGGGNFSTSGDSGSLIVADGGADDRKPVGLLFASGTGITIANPIDEVLTQLGVAIDGD